MKTKINIALLIILCACNVDSIDTKNVFKINPKEKIIFVVDSILINCISKDIIIDDHVIFKFDTIKQKEISINNNLLEITRISYDKNKHNRYDSLFFLFKRCLFKNNIKFYQNFSGYIDKVYYWRNENDYVYQKFWIDNKYNFKGVSILYGLSPIYYNDSIVNYLDTNKYLIDNASIYKRCAEKYNIEVIYSYPKN